MKAEYQTLQGANNQLTTNMRELDIDWIDRNTRAIQESAKNFDKLVELVNVPNILNQCLQQNQLVQATKVIRAFERNPAGDSQLLSLLHKEVSILRVKLVKIIYVKLEASFLGLVDGRSTKDLITLLKALGEERQSIESTLLSSRAKHLRDQVQKAVAKEGGGLRIIGLIERFLGHITGNMREFKSLRVEGADEWLLDRLAEARGLVGVYLQSVQKVEEARDIDKVVARFNSESEETLDVSDLLELRLHAIKDKAVEAIVKFTANQALAKLKDQVGLVSSLNVMGPDEKKSFIQELCQTVQQSLLAKL